MAAIVDCSKQVRTSIVTLPKVYENEGYSKSSHIYLTSPLRYGKKVSIVTQNEGPILLQGNNRIEFAQENFNQNVALSNFTEEGKDSFYVTGYDDNGCQVISYGGIAIRRRRPGFMNRVWPYPDIEHGAFTEEKNDNAPTTDTVKISLGPTGEVDIAIKKLVLAVVENTLDVELKTDDDPTMDIVEISLEPTEEVDIATEEMSTGSGGKSNENTLEVELNTSDAPTTDTVEISLDPAGEIDIATIEMSTGSGGKSNDNPLDLEL